MIKTDNFILQTFLKLTEKTYPFGTEDFLIESMIQQGIFPEDLQKDAHGNFFYQIGTSRTIFASHLDTACKDQTSVVHVLDGRMIKTDGKTILGADDKAGVTIMLFMIKNKIPGLYYFFVGEEVGCIGSGLASKYGDFEGKYDRIISFDRRDTGSVITFQSSTRCCSDVFAENLSSQLNKFGLYYKKDDGGIYTDSAEFVSIIPECTNLSVGYYREHTTSESQDISHLEKLALACLQIDWEKLPVKRNPKETEYKSYTNSSWNFRPKNSRNWRNRDYGYYDDWYEENSSSVISSNLDLDEDEDWPGQRAYNSFKRSKRKNKRGRKFYSSGDQLIEFEEDSYNKKPIKDEFYYDSLIDKILDSKLSNEDLEVVKEQYLDMSSDNDRQFYQYLVDNIV